MTPRGDLLDAIGERARARARDAESRAQRNPAGPAAIDAVLAAIGAPKPAPKRSSLRGRWAAALAPLAAAAAVVPLVRARAPVAAPLGEYSYAVTGRVQSERAAGDGLATSLEARAGSVQEVIVRPREAVQGPVAARVLVAGPHDGAVADVAPEVSERGVVRFELDGARLRGAREVRVVIAPPAALADAAEKALSGSLATGASVVVRIPVETPVDEKFPSRR